MTGDRRIKIWEDGTEQYLRTVSSMRPASRDPEEDARLVARHLAENHRIIRMFEEKGFGMEGDQPFSIGITRYLALRAGN